MTAWHSAGPVLIEVGGVLLVMGAVGLVIFALALAVRFVKSASGDSWRGLRSCSRRSTASADEAKLYRLLRREGFSDTEARRAIEETR